MAGSNWFSQLFKKPTLDVEENLEAAKQGDRFAMDCLAYCFEFGVGVKQDRFAAQKYYEKAYQLGSYIACLALSRRYEFGAGVERDLKKSEEFHVPEQYLHSPKERKRIYNDCKQGKRLQIPDAVYAFSGCYGLGIGVSPNQLKHMIELRNAADLGQSNAICDLGYYLLKTDPKNAVEFLNKGAEQGSPNACYELGELYESGVVVEKNEKKAFQFYQTAAKMGRSLAVAKLGDAYARGIGVEKDVQRGIQCFLHCAEKMNDPFGYTALANYYECEKDYEQAFKYALIAAEKNDPVGMILLGNYYHEGQGVAPNKQIAADWFKKAAETGNANAMLKLGIMYNNGECGERNVRYGLSLVQQAAALGDPKAIEIIQDLQKGKR